MFFAREIWVKPDATELQNWRNIVWLLKVE